MTQGSATRKRQNFAIGAVLFLLAEFWRDWFTPNTWTQRLLRFLLVIVSLAFMYASLRENSK